MTISTGYFHSMYFAQPVRLVRTHVATHASSLPIWELGNSGEDLPQYAHFRPKYLPM